jgi:hypothetical protein
VFLGDFQVRTAEGKPPDGVFNCYRHYIAGYNVSPHAPSLVVSVRQSQAPSELSGRPDTAVMLFFMDYEHWVDTWMTGTATDLKPTNSS